MNWKLVILIILVAAILAFFSNLYYHKLCQLGELREQLRRAQDEAASLEVEISRLAMEIDGLENDPEKLERLAREKLGLIRPNEKIFIIEPTPAP